MIIADPDESDTSEKFLQSSLACCGLASCRTMASSPPASDAALETRTTLAGATEWQTTTSETGTTSGAGATTRWRSETGEAELEWPLLLLPLDPLVALAALAALFSSSLLLEELLASSSDSKPSSLDHRLSRRSPSSRLHRGSTPAEKKETFLI